MSEILNDCKAAPSATIALVALAAVGQGEYYHGN